MPIPMRLPARRLIALAWIVTFTSACQRSPTEPITVKSASETKTDRVYVGHASSDGGPDTQTWRSEELTERASAQLNRLRENLIAQDKDISVDGLLAEGFGFTPLRPQSLATVLNDGKLSILQRASDAIDPTAAKTPAGDFADAIRRLRERYATLDRIDFKIVDLAHEQDRFWTSVLVQAVGGLEGSRLQENAVWRVAWLDRAGRCLMERLEVQQYEEIRSRSGPWLEDCTLAVFGAGDLFPEQLRRGTDSWMDRLPTALGITPWGDNGIAIGDIDGDHLDDVYLCQPGGLPNRLYVHRPNGSLRDVSAQSGTDWLDDSRSALFVDLDNDGDQDLVIASREFLLVMENDGRGRFRLAADVREARDAFSLAAADYDQDGDLDIFACRYYADGTGEDSDRVRFSAPIPYHNATNGPPNTLLRNEGNWVFHDASDDSGMGTHNHRWSYAAAWEDFDNDGDQDLYVANDFGPNNLFRNDDGTFAEVAASLGASDASTGMSVDWSDVDHDGWMDLYVANMYSAAGMRVTAQAEFRPQENADLRERHRKLASGNTLLVNRGGAQFEDRSLAAGVAMGRWAWSSNFIDLNNDSWDDILVANGYYSGPKKDDL